ncbi:hypothetical protein EDB19DRAFT_1915327 [Suillus lakei]|nr:hypothetical protein EDB19DRAFT_1915327 [Suillus lakei]
MAQLAVLAGTPPRHFSFASHSTTVISPFIFALIFGSSFLLSSLGYSRKTCPPFRSTIRQVTPISVPIRLSLMPSNSVSEIK